VFVRAGHIESIHVGVEVVHSARQISLKKMFSSQFQIYYNTNFFCLIKYWNCFRIFTDHIPQRKILNLMKYYCVFLDFHRRFLLYYVHARVKISLEVFLTTYLNTWALWTYLAKAKHFAIYFDSDHSDMV